MNRIAIIWEGKTVGFMEDPRPDMWYLEGKWLPSESPKTKDFLRVTQGLDVRESVRTGSNVWIELVEEEGKLIRATVMSAPSETIFVRRMIDVEPKWKWFQLWRQLTRG